MSEKETYTPDPDRVYKTPLYLRRTQHKYKNRPEIKERDRKRALQRYYDKKISKKDQPVSELGKQFAEWLENQSH